MKQLLWSGTDLNGGISNCEMYKHLEGEVIKFVFDFLSYRAEYSTSI